MQNLSRTLAIVMGASLIAPPGAKAAPLALPDVPLIVSTGVSPNVMLLIDNSGSMNNIIWADGYDHTAEYPRWERRTGGHNWVTMTRQDGNLHRDVFVQSACSDGHFRFRKATDTETEKCLKLPDPVGANATRFDGNYLNYLLETYPSGSDLTNGDIPTDYRMQVARDVSTSIVSDTPGMRFGVGRFNTDHGGTVAAECGSTDATLSSAIDDLTASNWTPLAESLYEITRYFRGMSSHYNEHISHASPIQYRCQRNFTIVVTDGMPTYDTSFPEDDPDDVADASRGLPNWDGENPETTLDMHPNYPVHSDGFQTDDEGQEGFSLFLDDVAKFAWDIDFRKTGNDTTGASFQDPRFLMQNMFTYTVGFAAANQMLEDAAAYGNGLYLTANNATELGTVLRAAVKDIVKKSGSSSAAAANAGFLGAGTKVYQARFNSSDWTGQLLAFDIDSDPDSATYGRLTPTDPEGKPIPAWDAAAEIPDHETRIIIASRNGVGIPFRWSALTSAADSPPPAFDEQAAWFDSDEQFLLWLRGAELSGLRDRSVKLGDIVNSAPVFVGAPNLRYPDNLESAPYSNFKTTHKNRTTMLYVGANDGMLHGFDAVTGAERLAYVPGTLLPSIKSLADLDYAHQYYVDGSPTVSDAFVGDRWRSILVGGLNKGGQAIYALDVTEPGTFSEANAVSLFKWEFTDAQDADLGYTFSQPWIAKLRMSAGKWAAIFGNGYNSTASDENVSATGNAALYVLDLSDGSLIRKIDTETGATQDPTGAARPNGLATVTPVDLDGDHQVDRVYAGDLFGNLWRFDLTDSDPQLWSAAKLFTACGGATCTTGASSNRQPITSRPSIGSHPSGSGVIVFFGTGKYLEDTDKNGAAGGLQSFYGIWDQGTAVTGRSQLLRQSIIADGSFAFDSETSRYVQATDPSALQANVHVVEQRTVSNNVVSWNTHRGWYLDLVPPGGQQAGERQVTASILRNGKIIFTTTIPNQDPCTPAGESWLMELDARNGGRLPYSPFDVNLDGRFTTADSITFTVNGVTHTLPPSGTKLDDGAAATPNVIAAQRNREFKHITTAEGLESMLENPGGSDTGRQSWRELGR